MIYVASSWKNTHQPTVVLELRDRLHDVYDFRAPDGAEGSAWSDIDPEWETWDIKQYAEALKHPLAVEGFRDDMVALTESDTLVLVLPCGKSAHLEAGFAAGRGAYVIAYIPDGNDVWPELMYKMFAGGIVSNMDDLIQALSKRPGASAPRGVMSHGERCAQILASRVMPRILALEEAFNRALAEEGANSTLFKTDVHAVAAIRRCILALVRCVDVACGWVNAHRRNRRDYCLIAGGDFAGLMGLFVGLTKSLNSWLGLSSEAGHAECTLASNMNTLIQDIDHEQAEYERSFDKRLQEQDQELDDSPFPKVE